MTTPHEATPEQWDRMEAWRGNGDAFANCTLELRDRIEALEAAAHAKPTSNQGQTRSSHPSHLVERVSAAIEQSSGHGEAIAAISVIAHWLETLSPRTGPRASRWLLNEVKRRG